MKFNRLFPLSIVLFLGILLAACSQTTTPVPIPSEPTVEPIPAADTTPPQVVMTELPFIAFYNLGTCTPAPMVWRGQVTDTEGTILSAEVLFRFSSEDGFRLSSDFRYSLASIGSGEYALSVQNSELNHVVAMEMFGTEKGVFEYRVIATDQAGNKQYYPSQSGWAQLALLPCLENANGDVAGSEGSADTSSASVAPGNNNSGSGANGASDFCAKNPSDPSCAPTTDPCLINPTLPSCMTVPNCEENPTNPSCLNIDPCVANPSDPSCTVTIDPCVANPADPSCAVTIIDPCDANPSDPSCAIIIDP